MATPSKKKRTGPQPDPNSKRSLGLPRHKMPRKAFHGPQSLFDALDEYVSVTRPQTSDSAVLREALEEYLAKRGKWPAKKP